MSIVVRPATLADVPAITAIHCSDIVAWKRWDSSGAERLARHEDLTTYERWLNGGAWMDETTCAYHLQRWQANGGAALVAEAEGQVLAEAEAMISDEPLPSGRNLNISVIYARRGHAGRGLGSALMNELKAIAKREHCDTLMVGHAEAREFYAKHGLHHFQTLRRVRVPVTSNQTRYHAERFEDETYETVRGWAMPIGRYQSARQEWERLRPNAEPDFPEWQALRLERWSLGVRRLSAWLILDESPRHPGVANMHLWLPPAHRLTRQLLAAVRDRAARSGFVELACLMSEAQLASLDVDWRDDEYEQQVWWMTVS
jgi:GNAT superfamily N-acetyltransferase